MDIPSDLQFTDPNQATALAHGIINNLPDSWKQALIKSAVAIHLCTEQLLTAGALTEAGADLLSYIRHLQQVSQGERDPFLINTLAPLFMVPDSTDADTDTVRRTFAEGVVQFSGLNLSFDKE